MQLEKKVSGGINRRGLIKGAFGLAGALALVGCKTSKMEELGMDMIDAVKEVGFDDPAIPNQIPTASIGMDFGDGLSGKVNYLLTGTDSDGAVADVYARVNNAPNNSTPWERYSNGDAIQVPIILGENSIESYVVDNKGVQSPIVTRDFISPTYENTEVRPVVDNLLIQRGYPEGPRNPAIPYFEKDSIFYVGSIPITPDYVIKDNFGVVKTFINLGYENRQDAIDDMNIINQTSIPQDTYIGLPTDEVQTRLNASLTNKGL